MKRTTRRWLLASVLALLVAAASMGIALADGGRKTVQIRGGLSFEPNEFLKVSFRFAPGTISVRSGKTVTWKNVAQLQEPHTVTIARRGELPRNLDDFFNCGAPGTPCALAQGHVDENFEPIPGKEVLNVGKPGLNTRGDSLFIPAEGTVTARISASGGKTLFYLCAIHPWMQGKINVKPAQDD